MKHATLIRQNRRGLLLTLVVVAVIYVTLPQLGNFRSTGRLISQADLGWLLTALAFALLTYFIAGLTYWLLAFKPLGYIRTAMVQIAAMFINRLLPGGIGAIGANYAYLRRSGHQAAQAAAAVAVNNLLGFLGHGLLAVVIFLAFPAATADFPDSRGSFWSVAWKAGLIALLAITAIALVFGRKRFKKSARSLGRQLASYRYRPARLMLALGSSILLTLCNLACFTACVSAVGIHLPLIVIFLIFSVGVAAGAATPTPGGLGGFEAGLVAGLIAYGVAGSPALAAALLYRLVSYWLPLAAGAAAFIVADRKQLFRLK